MSTERIKLEILQMSIEQKSNFLLESTFISQEDKNDLKLTKGKVTSSRKIENLETFNSYLNDMIKIVEIKQNLAAQLKIFNN